jgi:hypothetical protein
MTPKTKLLNIDFVTPGKSFGVVVAMVTKIHSMEGRVEYW